MSLVSGLALTLNQGYSTDAFNGASIPLNNPFQLNSTSLYDIYKASFNNSYNAFTPEKVFGKDYAEDFRQKTAGSGSKFQYTASSQQIMRNAGSYFHKKGTYTPKRGDIAIWTKTADPAHGHVGIVTKVEGDTVWITEGNSGNAVKTNKYSLSKLMSNAGSRPFNGFIDAHSWLGSDVALNAAKRAEIEKNKGVVESNTSGGGSNDSVDIRRYKRGAKNNHQWCAYFTSYCFTDGQDIAIA